MWVNELFTNPNLRIWPENSDLRKIRNNSVFLKRRWYINTFLINLGYNWLWKNNEKIQRNTGTTSMTTYLKANIDFLEIVPGTCNILSSSMLNCFVCSFQQKKPEVSRPRNSAYQGGSKMGCLWSMKWSSPATEILRINVRSF